VLAARLPAEHSKRAVFGLSEAPSGTHGSCARYPSWARSRPEHSTAAGASRFCNAANFRAAAVHPPEQQSLGARLESQLQDIERLVPAGAPSGHLKQQAEHQRQQGVENKWVLAWCTVDLPCNKTVGYMLE